MSKLYLLIILSSFYFYGTSQSSSLIEIDGINGGLELTHMTGVERNALSNPENGLLILNITTNCLNYYSQMTWHQLCGLAIVTCQIDSDCPTGFECIDGSCVPAQACGGGDGDPVDCPVGKTCVDGYCINTP